jgi:hypothetical protein
VTLFLILLAVLGFSFYKRLFIFSLLLVGAAILEYLTNKGQIKLNIGHVFFIALLLARFDNGFGAVLFVLLAGFLPQIFVGNVDAKNLISYPIQMIIVFLSSFFISVNFIVLGIILAILNYSLTFIIAKAVGEPMPELITEVGFPLFMNIVYFISIGSAASSLIARVIG